MDMMKEELEYRRFGVRMRAWRDQERLTARQVGAKIKASDTYVLNVENGLKRPPDSESAIGRALYALLDDQPTVQERFLWAEWSAAEFAMRRLGLAILMEYLPVQDLDAGSPQPTLAQAALPIAVDGQALILGLGGPEADLGEAAERSADALAGLWIDWLLQTTYQIGFVFAPYMNEQEAAVEAREDPEQVTNGPGFTRATMMAYLRYPVGDRLSVAVPFAF